MLEEKSSEMKIPLYHKSSLQENVNTSVKVLQKSKLSTHNPSTLYGVENSIDIKWSQSNIIMYLMSFLLASWLPMLLIIFLIHNTAGLQIDSQRSEVILLRNEIKSLDAEVEFLRSQVMKMISYRKDANHHRAGHEKPEQHSSSLETSLYSLSAIVDQNIYRNKRSAADDMQDNSKELTPTTRKVSMNNSSRRGLQAVQLKGAHPETFVETGKIGPWFIDSKALKDVKVSSSFQLREDGESVEIGDSGMYFIYAQVYYLTSHPLNSFAIILAPKDTDSEVMLAFCSSNAVSSSSTSEVSCFTATMHTLQAGDRIFVQQREKHRRLIMRSGHSFLGLIKIGGN